MSEPEAMEELGRARHRSLTPRGLWRVASYRFGFYRLPERAQMAVAWRLPRWLVYWSTVRAGAHATTGKLGYHQHMPSVLFVDVIKSWSDNRGGDRWAERYNKREVKKLRRLIERWTGHRG